MTQWISACQKAHWLGQSNPAPIFTDVSLLRLPRFWQEAPC
ncbi:MAG: hypothetical protein RIG27_17225 [Coleofasciculus sp. F4-SAH-05]